MPHLLTVRWPLFARLEAILLFPLAMVAASEFAGVHTFIARWMAPTMAPAAAQVAIPYRVTIWCEIGIVILIPYIVLLIVADRFLTIRKGFAILSVLVIGIWIWAAQRYSDQLAEILPAHMVRAANWRPFSQEAPLAAAMLASLLHLPALWVGLRDRGDVAMRLLAPREENDYRPEDVRHAQDVYYRQTADFRGWRPREEFEGMDGVPRENSAVKVLSALTWFAIIVGVAAAYHNWDSVAPSGHSLIRPVAEPDVESGSSAGGHIAVSPPGKPVGMPAAPLTPTQLTAPPLTLGAGMHSAAVVPLPSVQRPTDVSANGANVGSNEAAAQRGGDGSFVFDAVVNGGHARMIFDTGASAVVLRAEDAAQLGINVTRLNYSTKIKTANGTAEVAPVMIDKLVIGNITQRNVIGVVAKEGTLHENLLGQTFLARLAGLNVENNLLVLRGR